MYGLLGHYKEVIKNITSVDECHFILDTFLEKHEHMAGAVEYDIIVNGIEAKCNELILEEV